MFGNTLLLCTAGGSFPLPAKSRLGVSATMTANHYSGAATLTFTVDGAALNAAEISRLVKITSSTGSFMGKSKYDSPRYLSVSGSGTAAINGSAVKINFSWKCKYSTASEYSFACDGIFAGNPFRCEVKVDLENSHLGYNRFVWK